MSVTVPDVTGLDAEGAEDVLIAAGLTLGTATTAHSRTVEKDLVISQDPAAGEEVELGSPVAVLISLGPVTPTGVLGKLVDGLRKCVASSTTFQKMVGADNATEALEYVYAWQMEDSVEPPFAFVGPSEEIRERVSTAGAYPERGGLVLGVVLELEDGDELEAFYTFDNARDAIISEVCAEAESSGFVHINTIELDADGYGLWGPREARARGKRGIQAWHVVTWGF